MVLSAPPRPRLALVPILESGDHLTPEEFRRRYELRPDIKHAELIDGVVYVASPVRFEQHAEPHIALAGEFALYLKGKRGIRGGDNATVRFPDGSEVQPDGLLRKTPRTGGGSRIQDGYVYGPPELCAEIAASSVSYDLYEKKELYRRAGVQEYIVWRIEDEAIDWWELVGDAYVPIPLEPDGSVQSRVFPGFSLRPKDLVESLRQAFEDELDD
jgi:Uma2 family endonuclease